MITLKLQAVLIFGSLICLIACINLIRKYKLELKYSMLWLFLVTAVLLMSLFPYLLKAISRAMGIELPVNALFLFAIFGAYIIIFSLTMTISRSSTKLKEISQEVGLLKLELEKLKRNERNQNE